MKKENAKEEGRRGVIKDGDLRTLEIGNVRIKNLKDTRRKKKKEDSEEEEKKEESCKRGQARRGGYKQRPIAIGAQTSSCKVLLVFWSLGRGAIIRRRRSWLPDNYGVVS